MILLGLFFVLSTCQIHQELEAKATTTKLRQFGAAIAAKGPGALDEKTLETIAREESGIDHTRDAWGHELEIEMARLESGELVTRLISLGRDGRRGSCCTKWVSGWDEDAVLQVKGTELEWVQVWKE